MFQLLNPIWLFAIAAISIPVAIHLWNIRPGKTLKVGSISLIGASSRKSSRSLSLMEILLLLLRCLLLIVLSVLLAQPYLNITPKPLAIKGWVLVPRQHLHQVYTKFKPKVDSLIKTGYQLHYFNTGFAAADTTQYKNLADSPKAGLVKNWVLLKQLNQYIPANLPVYLFAPNMLNSVSRIKPALNLNLHIQYYTPADSINKWVQNAALTNTDDAIRITEGSSSTNGTIFTSAVIQGGEQRKSVYQVNINNGQPIIGLKNDTLNKPVAVDTATLRISIYSNKNSIDANYLNSAITAIKQFTQNKIQIVRVTDAERIPSNQNWIFWLSDQPVPLSVNAKTNYIFKYRAGKIQNVNSWLNGTEHIALTKRVAVQNIPFQTIWTDGFGNPVLALDEDLKTYSLYTHFDPAWNDIVWSDTFPQMMLNLLFKERVNPLNDRRTIDEQQLNPNLTNQTPYKTNTEQVNKTDLSKILWLALILLFLMERIFAHRNKTIENG